MQINIVTINYNGSEDTINLLKSLTNQTDKNFQIVVVDNASEETDFSRLREVIHLTPSDGVRIKTVRNAENLGFSGGNNIGISHALNPPA
ncbi:MAG: glycosyltransferase, partial [Candidatus Colwellbacteria bacterium]|nr:glycosyltransferase [Candidatus Colwellbacteria bacterium]